MIEIRNVTKAFDSIKAVDKVSVSIKENTVFGLIGTNGAGKSTVLRMVAGVLEPDEGEIAIDGIPVYDNMEAKSKIYFIADEPYFFANSNAMDMQKYLLEDICDHVGLLHKGGVLLSKDLEDMKCNIQKIQCVFSSPEDEAKVISSLDIMKNEKRGSLNTLTVRGNKAEILAIFATVNTVFFEALPLSLEEIFISETEVVGYDIKKLILG